MQPTSETEEATGPDVASIPPYEPAPGYEPGPSLKPALVILLIVAVVVFGGLALALVGGNGAAPIPVTPGSKLAGSPLAAVPAAPFLAPIVSDGEPPTAVINAVAVPSGSTKAKPPENVASDDGQFNSAVYLAVPATPADVLAFYKVELHHSGWGLEVFGESAVDGDGTELLYERAGPDGYYWEVAVIVTPKNPLISPPLAGSGQTAPTSLLELDLLQLPDAS
jgi:hypothetical protein